MVKEGKPLVNAGETFAKTQSTRGLEGHGVGVTTDLLLTPTLTSVLTVRSRGIDCRIGIKGLTWSVLVSRNVLGNSRRQEIERRDTNSKKGRD